MARFPKRYSIAILVFFGYINLWQFQNFVRLTNITLPSHKTQKEIDTAVFAHRVASLSTCFGGFMASKYGGKYFFGFGVALSALVNILMPAYIEYPILFVYLEFLDGIFQAIAISAVPDIWSRWSPMAERSTLVTFSYGGTYFAFLEFYLTLQYGNWGSFFYIRGISGLLWSIIWLFVVKKYPVYDESLTTDEKRHLSQNADFIKHQTKGWIQFLHLKCPNTTTLPDRHRFFISTFPWTSIRTSQPFWILCVTGFIFSWGNIFASVDIASYVADTCQINTDIITVPSILIFFFVAGYAADFMQRRSKFTTEQIRKFYTCIGFSIGILAMVSFIWKIVNGVVFLLIFDLSKCLIETALIVNVIDLSPKYSSLLWGFVKTCMNIGELVVQYPVKQFVLKNDLGWDICTHAIVTLYIVGAILYYVGGSTEIQSWNGTEEVEQNEQERENIDTAEEA